jgi:leucyl aminopeptidase
MPIVVAFPSMIGMHDSGKPSGCAMTLRFAEAASDSIPIWFVNQQSWNDIQAQLGAPARRYCGATNFEPMPGRYVIAPAKDGTIAAVVFAIESSGSRWQDPFLPGRLAALLPKGTFHFANTTHDNVLASLAWLLTAYRFSLYRKSDVATPGLIAAENVNVAELERIAAGVAFGRDLINTPANDLDPEALERASLALAKKYRAKVKVIRGEALLKANFPLVLAVGRASRQPPRLVEFVWGSSKAPTVALVGKGVVFDTGGLHIKPGNAMALMKKDMGGAATALSLAQMIMDAGLPIRLQVILAIVENAISGNAFRPGDIYRSRKGLSVEIGDTDAEGRLILADALTYASEQQPDLLFDFATLTGAARVALGPDIVPFYTDDDGLAAHIAAHARKVHDPLWRMPLWGPYESLLDGKISNLNNVSGGPFAGSITAALFLRRFVGTAVTWAHFDVYGWNPKALPGRPEGGEIQVARALYDLLETRYR